MATPALLCYLHSILLTRLRARQARSLVVSAPYATMHTSDHPPTCASAIRLYSVPSPFNMLSSWMPTDAHRYRPITIAHSNNKHGRNGDDWREKRSREPVGPSSSNQSVEERSSFGDTDAQRSATPVPFVAINRRMDTGRPIADDAVSNRNPVTKAMIA
uniref:Secreted protein n=1 Tax=Plectus sambesii TaxID=2011161 RepID=A0A914VK15_9BILA